MYTVGLSHESNQEIAAALKRADRDVVTAVPRTSDVVKLASIVCIGAGVMLGGIAEIASLSVLGIAALWLSFNHDDTSVGRNVESLFDPATGLPLFEALESVLGDDLVAASVSGRFAVVSLEVPEIAVRSVANDHGAEEALMASVTHRLQSHGWVGSSRGPFGPLIFLRRPGVFYIVLRDVIDDQTTRWLAGRLLEIVNRPVRWDGTMLEPSAVIGLAVGPATQRLDLVGSASEARCRARRDGVGSVVCSGDRSATAGSTWLVSRVDHQTVGCILEPAPGGGELFGEAAAFLRAFDEAIETAKETDSRCFVRAHVAALSHWDTPARVAARVNASGAHGSVGIIVSADLVSTARGLVWETVEQLRRCGIVIFVDRSDPASDVHWDPSRKIDGIVLPVGNAPTSANAAEVGELPISGAAEVGTDRIIDTGSLAQNPKHLVTPVR